MKTFDSNTPQNHNEAHEPLAIYFKNPGEKFSFLDFLNDKMLVIKAIREGLPFKLFSQIRSFVLFSDNDWAEYLDISAKSLQRYQAEEDFRFKSIHSEKIIEIAEVTKYGVEVFGSFGKFQLWLNKPSFALGGYKPGELIGDSYGKELVMAELNAIEHGIFA